MNAKIDFSSPVSAIPGIGPVRQKALSETGIASVGDLLKWLPRKYLDRSRFTAIRDLEEGVTATVSGVILEASKTRGRRPRFIARISDESGILTCVWFAGASFIGKRLKPGLFGIFTGKPGFYRGLQMTHPEFEVGDEEASRAPGVLPLYRASEVWSRAGFDSRLLRKWIKFALERVVFPASNLPAVIRKSHELPGPAEMLRAVHFPTSENAGYAALSQMRFCELFFLAYALLKRKRENQSGGIAFPPAAQWKSDFLSELPFSLTNAQQRVLGEIEADVFSTRRMNRLVQGDVGCGKTIVGILAALSHLKAGFQVAFMAPTEILVRQHYEVCRKLLAKSGLRVEVLTGSMKAGERKACESAMADGSVGLVVGTHALLGKKTKFHKLGMVIVDEQHRFGVEQRLRLYAKGKRPDLLVMSATPIPRTVALVVHGDLDVSMIDEKPPGRKEPVTRLVPEDKRKGMHGFIREQASRGEQIFVVLPLVESSENLEDIASAEKTAHEFRTTIFPDLAVGLLHGRLSTEGKSSVMKAFAAGETAILVSTTVVEVGMDIPAATVMVVEHAERFGLSQLHQLRGRIGRSEMQSYCLLLPSCQIADESLARLKRFCGTTDGFKISEIDLEIRGPGDLLGVRQSGFKAAQGSLNPLAHPGLFLKAREAAHPILEGKVKVSGPERQRLSRAADRLLAMYRSFETGRK